MVRMAATIARSEPARVKAIAMFATNVVATTPFSQVPIEPRMAGTAGAAGRGASDCPGGETRGGLTIQKPMPAATLRSAKATRAQPVSQRVAARTPASGPTMKDSSVRTESRASAVRRRSTGTAASMS